MGDLQVDLTNNSELMIKPEFVIDPAKIHSCSVWKDNRDKSHPKYDIAEVEFEVSVTHQENPKQFSGLDLVLRACVILGERDFQGTELTPKDIPELLKKIQKPWLVFLCGGPGAANPPDRCAGFNDPYVKRGYAILYLDYRGTGKSINVKKRDGHPGTDLEASQTYLNLVRPVSEHPRRHLDSNEVKEAADLFIQLREDSIVRDLEAIRQCLMADRPEDQRKWRLFGQSYGGWISISYLSLYPEGLETVIMTAGLAPITVHAVEAKKHLFKTVIERNDEYYAKYPEDVKRVNAIVRFFIGQEGKPIELPTLDILSFRRFLCMGRNLGLRTRWAGMHKIIEKFFDDINKRGEIQEDSKKLFVDQDFWKFNDRPLYAILHEAMYCTKGGESKWAALEAAGTLDQYQWVVKEEWEPSNDQEKIYFSGEMVYPFMFHEYKQLEKDVYRLAQEIATRKLPPTYDPTNFGAEVPVYSLSYKGDFHVNNEQSENTAKLMRKVRDAHGQAAPFKHGITGPEDWENDEDGNLMHLEHSSIREHVADVLKLIWKLEEEGAK